MYVLIHPNEALSALLGEGTQREGGKTSPIVFSLSLCFLPHRHDKRGVSLSHPDFFHTDAMGGENPLPSCFLCNCTQRERFSPFSVVFASTQMQPLLRCVSFHADATRQVPPSRCVSFHTDVTRMGFPLSPLCFPTIHT